MSTKQMIGQFELQGILGSGGIGHVHAAIDKALGREVAIKSLRPELLNDNAFLERFRAEAVNLARLNHPNIATLYSLVEEHGNLFMVMELVRGKSLEDVLDERKAPFGIQESIATIAQAADGLAYAHEMGVIHRDIKPANLMISDAGRVKVMDFGIARMRGSQRLTRDGSIVGTLAYISPEQLKGQEGDQRSDLYSLAIVFYELLAGKVPFEASTDYDLIQAHVTKPPPKLGSIVAGVPPAIEAAIMKALAKKPEARFASVSEFTAALGADDVRLNATSIIRSPEHLLESKAQTGETMMISSIRTGNTGAFAALKTKFLALPIEMRGVAIGGVAALGIGAALVLPSLLASPPPPVMSAAQVTLPIAGLPMPQPIIVQAPPSVPVAPATSASVSSSTPSYNRNFPLAQQPEPVKVPEPAMPATAMPPPALPMPITPALPAPGPSAIASAQTSSAPVAPPSSALPPAPAEPKATLELLQRAVANQDFGVAFTMAKYLAEAGDVEAQFILGNLYRSGRGTRLSHIEAALWYERAADKRHARAANNLANLYEEDLLSADKRSNASKAALYFQQAADLGHAHAQFRTGQYYERGAGGLQRNREKAVENYRKAAEQNNEDARQRLKQLGIN